MSRGLSSLHPLTSGDLYNIVNPSTWGRLSLRRSVARFVLAIQEPSSLNPIKVLKFKSSENFVAVGGGGVKLQAHDFFMPQGGGHNAMTSRARPKVS